MKRFIQDDGRGVSNFLAEVLIINCLRHKNIVSFIGTSKLQGAIAYAICILLITLLISSNIRMIAHLSAHASRDWGLCLIEI